MPQGLRTLMSGSLWLVLSAGLSQGSMLMANVFVANLLGVASFGRYSLLQTSVTMLASLAQLGFGVVVTQQVSKYRNTKPSLAGEIAAFCYLLTCIVSVVLAGALLAGRGTIAAGLFGDGTLAPGIACAALALPWFAITALQQGLFNGLERFRDQAKMSLGLIPLVVLLPLGGAYYAGVEGALIGVAVVYLTRAAVAQVVLTRVFRSLGIAWTFRNLRERLPLLWDYALPALLAGVLTALALWGGQTLLIRSEGGSAALGLFAAAYSIKMMVMFVPAQMIGALLPVITRHRSEPQESGHRDLLYLNVGLCVALTLAMAIVGSLIAPQILSLFGPGFAMGAEVLVILLLATPLEAATITLYQEIQSKGRFWSSSLSVNLPLAAAVLVGAAILVPDHLARGLAFAWLGGWLIAFAGTIAAIALHRQPE